MQNIKTRFIFSVSVVKWFIQSLRRQISFVHLAQTSRGVLLCNESVTQMVEDLNKVDLSRLAIQAGYADSDLVKKYSKIYHTCKSIYLYDSHNTTK